MMVKHPPLTFEYSEITPYIYLGTNMCCNPHFRKSLLKQGVIADISLEDEALDTPFGVKYYMWLPTNDHRAPSMKQLLIGTNFISELVRQKVKCFIHCKRGHGRSPILVAAYLIKRGKSGEKAISFIKRRRPSIHPNKKQLAALKRFERVLRMQRV